MHCAAQNHARAICQPGSPPNILNAFFFLFLQVKDLKAKLAVQEVELWQRNSEIEALIAKIGQQTDKLNQERAVADAEEQRVGYACWSRESQHPVTSKCPWKLKKHPLKMFY